MTIDAVLDFARRYREEALRQGQTDIAARLERVPAYGARTFPEALQSLRILHYAMWCEGEYHNTLGRFDQYMYPYFQRDRESGALAPEERSNGWKNSFSASTAKRPLPRHAAGRQRPEHGAGRHGARRRRGIQSAQ